MRFFKVTTSLLLFLSLIGCQSQKTNRKAKEKPAGEIKESLTGNFTISGAYALYPLISKLADEFMSFHPGVKIDVEKTSTGEGIKALLEKRCQLAMISRPATDEENNAGIITIAVAKDGVAPIVNQRNPFIEKILTQGISPEEYVRIFISGKKVTWGEILETSAKDVIHVYTRQDESGAADIFAGFLYKKAVDIKGTGVMGDEEMIARIQNDILGIGYCNFSYAFDLTTGERRKDIQVIPSDLDFDNKIDRIEIPFKNLEEAHRSLWLGFYPENLCRELSLASIGKPEDPAVAGFLRYVLGDGQELIKSAGLCTLNNVYIRYGLQQLE